jgi:hypothetical protein
MIKKQQVIGNFEPKPFTLLLPKATYGRNSVFHKEASKIRAWKMTILFVRIFLVSENFFVIIDRRKTGSFKSLTILNRKFPSDYVFFPVLL